MSTLDDFFGSSETAVKECLYCGKSEGELTVSITDAYGPTHWVHKQCEDLDNRKRSDQIRKEKEFDMWWENHPSK